MERELIKKVAGLWQQQIIIQDYKSDGTSNVLDVLADIQYRLENWLMLHAVEGASLTNNTKDFKEFITPDGVKLCFKQPVCLLCKKKKYSFYVKGVRVWERDLSLPYFD